ncbi:MAG TPA: hypothetical protein VI958_12375 [Acidobacteriota bacterium]
MSDKNLVEGDLIESFNLQEYIAEVVLLQDATSIGHTIGDAPITKEIDLAIIGIDREGETIPVPPLNLFCRKVMCCGSVAIWNNSKEFNRARVSCSNRNSNGAMKMLKGQT